MHILDQIHTHFISSISTIVLISYLLLVSCICRNKDSSGFEHVFVGESRGKEVIGFHNWIQFYLQEKLGNVDYQGYIRGRGVRGVRHVYIRYVIEWLVLV